MNHSAMTWKRSCALFQCGYRKSESDDKPNLTKTISYMTLVGNMFRDADFSLAATANHYFEWMS